MELFVRMKIIICITIFLNTVGIFAVALNYPVILKEIIIYDHPHMPRNDLIALASSYKSWLDALTAALMFLLLPVLGGLSDVVGRKPILIYSTISTVVAMLTVLMAYETYSMWMLFVAKFAGYTSTSLIYIVNGYVSDIANPQAKARDLGRVMATYGLGLVVAPVSFGKINQYVGIASSLMIGISICFLNVFVIIFGVKESLSYGKAREMALNVTENETSTKPSILRRFNPFRTWHVVFNRQNYYVMCLSILYIIYAIGESDILDTAYLYTDYRYNWNLQDYSLYMSLSGTAMVLYLGFALGYLVKRFSEKSCLKFAMFIGAFAHLVYAFAFEWYIFVSVVPISCMATSASPVLQTLVAKNVKEKDMGSALSALGSFFSLSQFIGAILMENIFAYFISSKAVFVFPGAHFLLGSILLLSGAIGSVVLFRKYSYGSEAKYLEERAPILLAQDLTKRRIDVNIEAEKYNQAQAEAQTQIHNPHEVVESGLHA